MTEAILESENGNWERAREKKESQSFGDFLNERARGYSFLEYGTLYRRTSRDEESFNSMMKGGRCKYLEHAKVEVVAGSLYVAEKLISIVAPDHSYRGVDRRFFFSHLVLMLSGLFWFIAFTRRPKKA